MIKSPADSPAITAITDLFVTRFLNRLVPHHCPICGQEISKSGLCGACWNDICFITPPICLYCGAPLPRSLLPKSQLPDAHMPNAPIDNLSCGACLKSPSPVDRSRAVCRYDVISKSLILPFKHGARLELSGPLAQMMQAQFHELIRPDTLIMPIPLHFTRRLYRRYNQSAELARHLCAQTQKSAQLDVMSLYRRKATRPLARHSKDRRRVMLRDAFALRPHATAHIKGRPILLIDDVLTTGQTSTSAAALLKKHGAAQVDCLAFAKVI